MQTRHNIVLRDYQKECCRKTVDCFEKGLDAIKEFWRLLLVVATGGGKTIMASAVIWYWVTIRKQRCLFLADANELVEQAVDKIRETSGLFPDVEKGALKASMNSQVVVSSIQTMQRKERLAKFPPDHFGLVIADEAHLSMAKNWQRVLKHFGEGGAKILGITATPMRLDKKSLMRFYEHIPAEVPLFDLISQGYLAPVVVQTVPLEIDLSQCKIERGEDGQPDLDKGKLEELLTPYFDAVLREIRQYAAGRRIIVYTPLVRTAEFFAERARLHHGFVAECVSGDDPKRAEKIRDYREGRIEMLVNAMLLSKGFDDPRTDCIVILRPTLSRTMYQQMVGRGTRLWCPHGCHKTGRMCDHPDRKKDMLLLDFLWQYPKHGLIRPENLLDGAEDHIEEVGQELRKPGQKNLLEVETMTTRKRAKAMIRSIERAGRQQARCVDAREWGAIMAPELLEYEPFAKWECRKPSEAQLALLAKMGIDRGSVKSFGQAHKLLDMIFDRIKTGKATMKQARILIERDQFDPDMTVQEASRKIAEGRRKPVMA